MRRPVLFWHNYKSVTMVGMGVKARENREGLRILCCVSKASGHLGASVFSLKEPVATSRPLAAGAHTLKIFPTGVSGEMRQQSAVLSGLPALACRGQRWAQSHSAITNQTSKGGGESA